MTDSESPASDRLSTAVAILVATATVLGALVAWRASVAADAAGDADGAGLRAVLSAEQSRASGAVTAYEDYSAFSAYARHRALAEAIGDDLAQADAAEAEQLQRELNVAGDLATAAQTLFPSRFLNRDGSYAVERQIGELRADDARAADLNPEPHFAEADALRAKTSSLLAAATVIALALVFFTLVEPAGRRLRYPMLALGTLCVVAGSGFAAFVELAAR
jgi:hypothetical protein